MRPRRKDVEKHISNVGMVIIVLVVVSLLVGLYFYITFVYNTPCVPPPNLFVYSLNVNKTSEGWVIKLHGWLEICNQLTGRYDKSYEILLSKLQYTIYNTSHFYEERYVSSIKNKASPYGVIFYDADNDSRLSDADYMFILQMNGTSNSTIYPHSGDFIYFHYMGYLTRITNGEKQGNRLP